METGRPELLTSEERHRLELAVQRAERRTSAEIVPMVVARSGRYREARYRAGLMLALLTLTGLLLYESSTTLWGWHAGNGAWLVLAMIGAYGVGVWIGGWPLIIRLTTSSERRRQKVRLRAERAFTQLGVGGTRDRTGLLLLVSLLEHHVSILPDRPLAERLTQEAWQSIVDVTLASIREGQVANGLIAGVERCGQLLAEACPANASDNPNELPDRVRLEP